MSVNRVSTGALVLTLAAATIGILVSIEAASGRAEPIRALRDWQAAGERATAAVRGPASVQAADATPGGVQPHQGF